MSESMNEELIALLTASTKHNEALCKSLIMQSDLIAELLKRQKTSVPEPSVSSTKNDDSEPGEKKLTREDFWRNMPRAQTGLHTRKCDPDALHAQLDDARELIKFYRAKLASE